jgi:hypothetical protein
LVLWDWVKGEKLAAFSADAPLTAMTIAPYGNMIAAGDAEGGVHLLRIEGVCSVRRAKL